jgi:hypothetical protein
VPELLREWAVGTVQDGPCLVRGRGASIASLLKPGFTKPMPTAVNLYRASHHRPSWYRDRPTGLSGHHMLGIRVGLTHHDDVPSDILVGEI